MNTDYSDLNLAGSFINEISLIPGQALIVKVLRGPVSKGNRNVVEELMLELRNLLAVSAELRSAPAEPSIEIVSYSVHPVTNAREETPSSTVQDTSDVQIVINCDKGDFDVTAGSFTWSVINEIPFFPSSASAEIGFSTVMKQLESEQVTCSFCGRKSTEVARIVKGNDACICIDCVKVCSGLLDPSTQT